MPAEFLEKLGYEFSFDQKTRTRNFKNSKSGHLRFPKNSKFLSFRFLRKMFYHFPGMFPDFLLIRLNDSGLTNKMEKYGLQEPKTVIIHEMLSF